MSGTWALPPTTPTPPLSLLAQMLAHSGGALPSFRNPFPGLSTSHFLAPPVHFRSCLPKVALTPSSSFMDSRCFPVPVAWSRQRPRPTLGALHPACLSSPLPSSPFPHLLSNSVSRPLSLLFSPHRLLPIFDPLGGLSSFPPPLLPST